jgi:hypothetical protein
MICTQENKARADEGSENNFLALMLAYWALVCPVSCWRKNAQQFVDTLRSRTDESLLARHFGIAAYRRHPSLRVSENPASLNLGASLDLSA